MTNTGRPKPERRGKKAPSPLGAWRSQRVAIIRAITSQLGHDLRQPLAAIQSNAQAALLLLEKDTQDLGEIREILNDIILDENRASAIIDALGKNHRRDRSRPKEVRLADIIQDVLDLLQSELEDQRIQVVFLHGSECVAMADEWQLRQVVLELVTNSIEAMRSQRDYPRRLQVSLAMVSPGMAQIMMTDSGPGVPEAEIPNLFHAFQTSKEGASGLGLFICRTIVQAHGGSIRYQKNPERGAGFYLTLPLNNSTAARQAQMSESQLIGPASAIAKDAGVASRKLSILIVDDSKDYRRATWSVLARFPNLELVGEAADGLEAVQRAEDLKPNLIFMDVSLSGINGIDAASRIRGISPGSKIVFLSQYDDPDVVKAVLHTGAAGYILKVDSGKDLGSALAAVSRGETFLSTGVRNCL